MAVPFYVSDLAARADGLRELLVLWANQNSGSDNFAGLERMLGLLEREFGSFAGATTERISLSNTPAQALRVRARPEAPLQVLLSGHYDTVYEATHPFQECTRISENRLRGPGVTDMKGGLVVMLAALQAFEQSPHSTQLGWEVLLGPDEEIGSPSTRPLWEEAARRHQLGLVFEPCRENGDLVRSRKGTGLYKLTCHGRAAHAGRNPEAGRNAILALAEFLSRVDGINHEIPGVMINVGRIRGGGAVNIVPDFAEAEINLRVTRAADEPLVLNRLRGLATPINAREGFRLEISGTLNRPPKEEVAAESVLFSHWQACAREFDLRLGWQHVGGGSDGNLLSAAGLVLLDGVGVHGGGMHSPEEYISLDSLVPRAQVAALFLSRLAAGEFSPNEAQQNREGVVEVSP